MKTIKKIEKICKDFCISNYTINDDMSIDVDGDVDIAHSRLVNFPLVFNNVSGNFNCTGNELTSLFGAPVTVGGYFCCFRNDLTNLIGGPVTVGGEFCCSDNELTSLEGSPTTVGDGFDCSRNKLTSLVGGPVNIIGYFLADEDITKIYNRSQAINELLN